MEEQRSKTLLKKKQTNESTTPFPINVVSTCLFLFIEVMSSLGTPFCYLVDLKYGHYSSLISKKKKLVPVHACVVRSLLSNLNCLCWYYHSALVMLARYYYSSVRQAKESVMMTHFQCHQCFSFFNRMRPQSIVNGYHDNDQYKMGPLLSVN